MEITEFDPRSFAQFSLGDLEVDHRSIRMSYCLDGLRFEESFTFRDALPESTHALARVLQLVASVSYYRLAAPRHFDLAGIRVTPKELQMLGALIEHGLAELAWNNKIEIAPEFVNYHLVETEPIDFHIRKSLLIPVGGGKDSIVSIEAAKSAGADAELLSVGSFDPIKRVARIAGLPYQSVERTLDPQLKALEQAGAYAGHVPVTAINSVVHSIAAVAAGHSAVIMSNESSANYPTIFPNRIEVNHQYSKSLEFERLLAPVVANATSGSVAYFSLLRGLNELQIAQRFAQYPQYWDSFVSCNRSYAQDPARRANTWCGECPKCEFAFLVLAPFIAPDEMAKIFGRNLLAEPQRGDGFRRLLGLYKTKPFECVGEENECRVALALTLERYGDSYSVAHELGDQLRAAGLYPSPEMCDQIMTGVAEHDIPVEYKDLLDALE